MFEQSESSMVKSKFNYHRNLGRCLREGYEMPEANSVAKELTDAQKIAEIEEKKQKIEDEIKGLRKHGLSYYKKQV